MKTETDLEIIDASPVRVAVQEIDKLSTEEIEQRFAAATQRTATGLAEMAACVHVMESRGYDLSKLRMAIIPYLRLIATGQLLPDAVLKFSVNAALLDAISKMPVSDQLELMKSGKVKVAVIETDRSIGVREIDPRAMSRTEISRVFRPSGIASAGEQLNGPIPRNKTSRNYRVRVDQKTRIVHVGRSSATVAEFMVAMAEAAGWGGLVPTEADGPSVGTRITQDERERLRAACKAMKTSENDFIRRAILSWMI